MMEEEVKSEIRDEKRESREDRRVRQSRETGSEGRFMRVNYTSTRLETLTTRVVVWWQRLNKQT